ncbi:MAG TPA: isocitrate/isopropylmalate dehydrogenase family protein [Thermomicrobiales bacterium]|nr:isocitrate/isopropylmalate dehydrogenase family protein [Thermomicrobiales bacterium]
MTTYRIIVIPGDGIGPEIVDAAISVLRAVEQLDGSFSLDLEYHDAGAETYATTGTNLSPETLAACREANAVLKGPVGLPDVRLSDGTEAGLLGGVLRTGLDTYANVRPIKLLPGIQAATRFGPGEIDYVIVRENTEGLYASRGRGVANDWAASDVMFMTRPGVERVCRFAFETARKRTGAPRDGVQRVTCVDKSNVLRSFGFFRSIFSEVAASYPDIEPDYLYADAAAQALVMDPARFDVLVMENFLGDILSDLGGGTIGGIGLCPSGNIGDVAAYFEPIHGSAPSLAGQDRANPIGQILTAAMLLDHIGQASASRRIQDAVGDAIASGAVRIGDDGCPVDGTRAAAEQIVNYLR